MMLRRINPPYTIPGGQYRTEQSLKLFIELLLGYINQKKKSTTADEAAGSVGVL